MPYLFTSESVSEGHPDKIADQISDALLDHFLAFDPDSKVACETLVTTGQVVLAGEVKSDTYLDVQQIARDVINRIGYTKGEYQFSGDSCGVISLIHEQSQDINQGVDRASKEQQGAGDQGMMFGYATKETPNYMPLALDISHRILKVLADLRRTDERMSYLRPDSKAQVTIEYSDDDRPKRGLIRSWFLPSTMTLLPRIRKCWIRLRKDIIEILIPKVVDQLPGHIRPLFDSKITYHINPTGKFVIGGPHGDTGLTGRKIIVDTYGGKGAHGGGAFSGKDPSKVDRSAAYAARHIAKNLVAAGVSDEILVQVSYAIGVVEPTSIFVDTYGKARVELTDGQIAEKVKEIFDMRPFAVEERLQLRNPIYEASAAYGHMGREPRTEIRVFESPYNGKVEKEVEFFTWEKLDYVPRVKEAFGLA